MIPPHPTQNGRKHIRTYVRTYVPALCVVGNDPWTWTTRGGTFSVIYMLFCTRNWRRPCWGRNILSSTKEPCTTWITLKIPPPVHCESGSEPSLLALVCLPYKLLTYSRIRTSNPIAPPPLVSGPYQHPTAYLPIGAFVCGMGYPTEADWSSATATGWGGDM